MNRFTTSLLLVTITQLLTACGGFEAEQPSLLAPQSAEEASSRFLVKVSSDAEAQAIVSASTAYRVISKSHNIYEVQGLNYFEIKDIAPTAHAEQNQYFESFFETKMKTAFTNFDFKKLDDEETPADEEQPEENAAAASQLPPAFDGCNPEATPVAKAALDVVNPEILDPKAAGATMNLGDSITLSAALTAEENPDFENLTYQWTVYAPNGSNIRPELQVGETLTIESDMVGFYMVFLVVKTENNACDYFRAGIGVTLNPEIDIPKSDDDKVQVDDLSSFEQVARMQIEKAWEKATGAGVTIAILDSGLNYNHVAIKHNLAFNYDELSGVEGEDDDNNMFKDDVLGWDFVNNDNMPFDDQGHGSHVAGLSASHVFGVAKDAKIMPVKVLGASGGADTASIIAGILYAADNGADVINASLGGLKTNFAAKDTGLMVFAIEVAESRNIPFIAASGNDNLDLSIPENEFYPGQIDANNVVNVMALSVNDQDKASYSNYDAFATDVAAPGGDRGGALYSLTTVNPMEAQLIGLAGTSMASPLVAGVTALIKEVNPDLTTAEVKAVLMSSGTLYPELTALVGSGRALSALDAVNVAENYGSDQLLQVSQNNL